MGALDWGKQSLPHHQLKHCGLAKPLLSLAQLWSNSCFLVNNVVVCSLLVNVWFCCNGDWWASPHNRQVTCCGFAHSARFWVLQSCILCAQLSFPVVCVVHISALLFLLFRVVHVVHISALLITFCRVVLISAHFWSYVLRNSTLCSLVLQGSAHF